MCENFTAKFSVEILIINDKHRIFFRSYGSLNYLTHNIHS